MGIQGPRTARAFQRAESFLVSGVCSGCRFWGADDTLAFDHGDGAHAYGMNGSLHVDHISRHWSIFAVTVFGEPPTEYLDYANHDEDFHAEVIMGMMRRGLPRVDEARLPSFLSTAHFSKDVASTLEAFGNSLQEAKN